MNKKNLDRAQVLLKEGQSFTYENFSPKDEYGYPIGLTPDYTAWRTKVETLLYTAFGKNSPVYQVFQRGASIATTGWGPDHFTESQGFILGSLQAAMDQLESDHDSKVTPVVPISDQIFIVHGHDEASKETVARFVEKLELHPIILHEQPNAGRTIIEKFEDHSNVGFAIVLLTPDDFGAPRNSHDLKPRARQNVILELGYFIGKLGRGKVCALYKEGVEIPSDYQGVLYIPMDSAGAWRTALAKEIKNAGIEVDLNKTL